MCAIYAGENAAVIHTYTTTISPPLTKLRLCDNLVIYF